MNMDQYLKDSARTASKEFHIEGIIAQPVVSLLRRIEGTSGKELDAVKKELFYGAPRYVRPGTFGTEMALGACNPDVVHALIGIMTEAGELAGPLAGYIQRGEIDEVNLMEESGDILWYLAMLFRSLGVSFEEVASMNIKKLRARYPEKFTQDQALNRNLAVEREVLGDAQ